MKDLLQIKNMLSVRLVDNVRSNEAQLSLQMTLQANLARLASR